MIVRSDREEQGLKSIIGALEIAAVVIFLFIVVSYIYLSR
jgi:hypothetical protein